MLLRKTRVIGICCFALIAIWGGTCAQALPQLTTHQETPTAVVHRPHTVIFELSWSGSPSEYASVPPQLSVDEWGSISSITTSTHLEQGKNVIRHAIAILPFEVGSFSIEQIDVPYFRPPDIPEKDENGETPDFTYPTLHAGVLNINVREPADYLLNTVMIAALAIVLFSCAFVFQRRNQLRIAQSSDYLDLTVPSIIHDAKKHRLDQNYYAFFQGLLRGAGLLNDSSTRKELQKYFEEQALSIGYKGAEPTDEMMDAAVQKLEHAHQNDHRNKSAKQY